MQVIHKKMQVIDPNMKVIEQKIKVVDRKNSSHHPTYHPQKLELIDQKMQNIE